MTGEWRVARQAGLIEAEVDGELLGLHVDNGACYGFNPTATRIWALIEQPRTLTELCGLLAEEFEIEPADARAEVLDLLQDLKREGLVDLQAA
jgi:Coenzyme PQQ synthesis protein D (PqqD)